MKAQELRIGNWIQSEHKKTWNEWKVLPEDIEQIYSNERLGIYKPIPLTTEWLEKFGFVDPANNGMSFRIPIGPADELCFYMLDFADSFVRFQTQGSGFTRSLPCKYVHQLQNLYFALTGEELTIK